LQLIAKLLRVSDPSPSGNVSLANPAFPAIDSLSGRLGQYRLVPGNVTGKLGDECEDMSETAQFERPNLSARRPAFLARGGYLTIRTP
jgi:hypothetical protein